MDQAEQWRRRTAHLLKSQQVMTELLAARSREAERFKQEALQAQEDLSDILNDEERMMMRLQDRDQQNAGKGLESVARSHQGDTQHAAAADAARAQEAEARMELASVTEALTESRYQQESMAQKISSMQKDIDFMNRKLLVQQEQHEASLAALRKQRLAEEAAIVAEAKERMQ